MQRDRRGVFRDVVRKQCSDKTVKGFKCQWTESGMELSYCL